MRVSSKKRDAGGAEASKPPLQLVTAAPASSAAVSPLLTVPEVAHFLRVKERLIYTWVSQGKIPYRKAGRFTLFDRDEIDAWTKQAKQ
jgi:excisionase family DNA binding protein